MKTFKLKALKIMAHETEDIIQKEITLKDGLVINREDESGWLLEAFIDLSYLDYFKKLEKTDELMIQVKITREENDPAFFITKIIGVNEISDNEINIIFQGTIVDHRKSRIEEMLRVIIDEGYQGESLLKKFKELI